MIRTTVAIVTPEWAGSRTAPNFHEPLRQAAGARGGRRAKFPWPLL